MNFQLFGNKEAPTLLLIPGLGVSYEIFLPLIRLVEERFRIIAVEVDGFTLGNWGTTAVQDATQADCEATAAPTLSSAPRSGKNGYPLTNERGRPLWNVLFR